MGNNWRTLVCHTCVPAFLGALLSLSACGGGSSAPPPPPPHIVGISLSPATARVVIESTRKFTATVTSSGAMDTTVSWSVNDVVGGNDVLGRIAADGTYTAPATIPASTLQIKAVANADSTKAARAAVTLLPILTVSPTVATVAMGKKQQFTTVVRGSDDTRVRWTTIYGEIGTDGLYTPPTFPLSHTITAIWISDDSVYATATVNVVRPTPTLVELAPPAAVVGQKVTIHGDGLEYNGSVRIVFPGPSGTTLGVDAERNDANELIVAVPIGARSGGVYAEVSAQPGVRTNSVDFERLPGMRVRSDTNELSSGESVQMRWSALGPGPVNAPIWTTNAGTVDDSGRFTAPVVAQETFVRVNGCLGETAGCDSVLFRVTPTRIVPSQPLVAAGESIRLAVKAGDSELSAEWSSPSGVGTISGAGEFTSTALAADAGAVPVDARVGDMVADTSVLVTEKFPGVVHRVQDFVDEHERPIRGWLAHSVKVVGNRAYVLGEHDFLPAINAPVPPHEPFLDVFDITNPDAPVWIGAVESPVSWGPLYTWGSLLYELPNYDKTLAVYDVSSGFPQLLRVIPLPDIRHNADDLSFREGRFVAFSHDQWEVTGTSDSLTVMDVSTGFLNLSSYQIALPPEAVPPVVRHGLAESRDRLALAYGNSAGATPNILSVLYDTTVSPPRYLGPFSGWTSFSFYGSLLLTSTSVYDVSDSIPVELASVDWGFVSATNGNKVALRESPGGNLLVVDITDPRQPDTLLRIPDGSDGYGDGAAWAGDRLLVATGAGGLATIAAAPKGGPICRSWLFLMGELFDMVVEPPYVYGAGPSDSLRAPVQVLDVNGDATLLAEYTEQQDAYTVRKKGSTVFVGMTDHLSILDASSPQNLRKIGQFDLPTTYLALADTVLFAATFDKRLVALDIAQPTAPVFLGQITLPESPVTMRLDGNLLVVADAEGGLLIYDVSVPAAPMFKGSYPCYAVDVTVSAGIAAVAAWDGGILVLDITNPSTPTLLAQTLLLPAQPWFGGSGTPSVPPNRALSLAFHDGLLWVHGIDYSDDWPYPAFLYAFDMRVPSAPRLVTMYDAYWPVYTFGFVGNQMFTGAMYEFVQYDISNPRNLIHAQMPPLQLLWWHDNPNYVAPGHAKGGRGPALAKLRLNRGKARNARGTEPATR